MNRRTTIMNRGTTITNGRTRTKTSRMYLHLPVQVHLLVHLLASVLVQVHLPSHLLPRPSGATNTRVPFAHSRTKCASSTGAKTQ